MKASLKELDGKYYGTVVAITSDNGYKYTINLWGGDYTPSKRELALNGFTEKQWEESALVDDGWGGKAPIRQMDITCDNHFESKETYELAEKLVKLINS